jgi:HAD domain in Swiss Army Knife RNA repair proteins
MSQSIIFTDVDDVLVLQRTADFNKHAPDLSEDICRRLLHPPAMQVLASIVDEGAQLVITSNWTRFLNRNGFQQLFDLGGYPAISAALHAAWSASRKPGGTRLESIDGWLAAHHDGEPYCILDDTDSGSGLRGSARDLDGRVILCEPGAGLHSGHLPAIRAALSTPAPSAQPARAGRSRRR